MTITYNIYRSTTEFSTSNLPEPIATGLTDKFFTDNVEQSTIYYYRIGAVRNGIEKVSELIVSNSKVGIAPIKLNQHGQAGLSNGGTFSDDNTLVVSPEPSFPFPFLGATYKSNIYVGSNSNISFGAEVLTYSAFTPANSPNCILINSQDHGNGTLYIGNRVDIPNTYIIRYSSTRIGTEIWETTLFKDGTFAILPIAMANGNGKCAISNSMIWVKEFTLAVGNTYWFYPNTDGSYDIIIK